MSSALTEGLNGVTSIGTSVIEFMTSNPIAMIFLAASLFGIGFGIFKKLKG